jgi:hypothetical protein
LDLEGVQLERLRRNFLNRNRPSVLNTAARVLKPIIAIVLTEVPDLAGCAPEVSTWADGVGLASLVCGGFSEDVEEELGFLDGLGLEPVVDDVLGVEDGDDEPELEPEDGGGGCAGGVVGVLTLTAYTPPVLLPTMSWLSVLRNTYVSFAKSTLVEPLLAIILKVIVANSRLPVSAGFDARAIFIVPLPSVSSACSSKADPE